MFRVGRRAVVADHLYDVEPFGQRNGGYKMAFGIGSQNNARFLIFPVVVGNLKDRPGQCRPKQVDFRVAAYYVKIDRIVDR